MWIFNKNKIINEECLDLILCNQDNIKIIKLGSPRFLGPSHDERRYTHKVGLFYETANTLFDAPFTIKETVVHPLVYWYCRNDGNIWGEWNFRLTKINLAMWPDNSKIANRLPMYTNLKYTMRDEYKCFMNKLSKEHFAMYLLQHG